MWERENVDVAMVSIANYDRDYEWDCNFISECSNSKNNFSVEVDVL